MNWVGFERCKVACDDFGAAVVHLCSQLSRARKKPRRSLTAPRGLRCRRGKKKTCIFFAPPSPPKLKKYENFPPVLLVKKSTGKNFFAVTDLRRTYSMYMKKRTPVSCTFSVFLLLSWNWGEKKLWVIRVTACTEREKITNKKKFIFY